VIELDEIVQEFLVESHENLDQLDSDLLALEQEPGSRALLGSIFRTIHTIKGTSGFLAYGHLEAVAHVGESLLSRLRDGELVLTPDMTGACSRWSTPSAGCWRPSRRLGPRALPTTPT
jgi:two-component system chemotaxis sensor kinase CheA